MVIEVQGIVQVVQNIFWDRYCCLRRWECAVGYQFTVCGLLNRAESRQVGPAPLRRSSRTMGRGESQRHNDQGRRQHFDGGGFLPLGLFFDAHAVGMPQCLSPYYYVACLLPSSVGRVHRPIREACSAGDLEELFSTANSGALAPPGENLRAEEYLWC